MKDKMKIAVMTELEKIEMTEGPVPVPGPKDLLVRVDYVGICGSDLHYYEHGSIGPYVVECPYVLGHEVGGTVVGMGKEVKTHQVGDRVALEPQITDPESDFSKRGLYNLDDSVTFFATPPVPGTFQEYVTHPANLCFTLPEQVSTLEGAMIEPLSVGLHAGFQGGAHLGQTALVTGAGCIGLCSLLAIKAMGVSRVIVSDISAARLQKAKELGADFVLNPKECDIVKEVEKITQGKGFDLGIESSGNEIAAGQQIKAAKKGSTIVFVGYSASGEMTLPMSLALDKELTFKTVFRYRNTYPVAIEAIASGKINVKDLVTDIYEFDDIQKGMYEALKQRDTIVKGAIKVYKEA